MMKPKRQRTLFLIIFLVAGIGAAAGLVLYALRQNINLYYTPSQLVNAHLLPNQLIRMGGIVQKNSVDFAAKGLEMSFILTDNKSSVTVQYQGILPALFREGQGIIVQGKLNSKHVLVADQVLAKHDEKYMPPGIGKKN